MTKSYVLDVKTGEDGESFVELPEEILEEMGWKVGDTLVWEKTDSGSYVLKKEEKEDDANDSGN